MYKINKQLLGVPFHYNDMTAQASMTGITVLKQGKFKQRHGGPKEIIQLPREGLKLRRDVEKESDQINNLKQLRKKRGTPTPRQIKPREKTGNYTVNKKEVTHRIRNFVNQMSGERKLYFWTITFPSGTDDDTAFLCFNKWLTRVRKELNLRSYLWITERQDGKRLTDSTQVATNTIHFHIAIHQRLCVKKANRFMRACLFTCIDQGLIKYSRIDAKNYNGVDISKNRKTRRVINFALRKSTKSLTNYLTKYITKNAGKFKHLAWHSSRDYSNLIISVRLTDSEYLQSGIENWINLEVVYEGEWFRFFKWKDGPPGQFLKYMARVNQQALSLLNQ